MKTDLQTLKDLFKVSYEAYESSRIEEKLIRDLYHNRQYSGEQLATLSRRGQPAETFNIVKFFARLLVGYYSTVVNTVKVAPRQQPDTLVARALNDIVQYTFEQNLYETEGSKVKLDGMLSGLMCNYCNVVDTGEVDEYGRPIRRIELTYVPSREILLDPMSYKEDYSDARYIHRFKWVSEDYLKQFLKSQNKRDINETIRKLNPYDNHLNQSDTEFTDYFEDHLIGYSKQYDNYLLVHTIIEDDKGKSWSIFWCGDTELSRKEVTYREVKFPYRVQRLHVSDKAEYYGLFRELAETQNAINQALLKIQVMANTQKIFVEGNAIEDLDKFTDAVNRVNSIIEVKKISGIKIENLSREILEQYALIDKGFDRCQKMLGINDSFLGRAFASDSGRKVKLQQNATTMSLNYVTTQVQQFYRLLGWDIVKLAKQYYTAHEVLRVTDVATGHRWLELNKPMQMWSGEMDAIGHPIMKTPLEEVVDPASGEPIEDKQGNLILAPVPEEGTEIAFANVDISIDSAAYNDEDEKNQLMLETVLQGPIGMSIKEANPAGYLRIAGLSLQSMKTKHSHEIADIIKETAARLSPQHQELMALNAMGAGNLAQEQGPMSQQLKLPQNTNEEG